MAKDIKPIDRIKRFSKKFKGPKTICGKTWDVIDASNNNDEYIFLPDGIVYIIKKDKKLKGSWNWIDSNSSLAIEEYNEVFFLKPEYVDESFMAFERDSEIVLLKDNSEQLVLNVKDHDSKVNQYLKAKYHKILEDKKEAKEIFQIHSKIDEFFRPIIIISYLVFFTGLILIAIFRKDLFVNYQHVLLIIIVAFLSLFFISYTLTTTVLYWGIIKKWFLK